MYLQLLKTIDDSIENGKSKIRLVVYYLQPRANQNMFPLSTMSSLIVFHQTGD
jgi:hypothetical protein